MQATFEDLVRDLVHTRFELPDGFDEIAFWPLGIGAGLPADAVVEGAMGGSC